MTGSTRRLLALTAALTAVFTVTAWGQGDLTTRALPVTLALLALNTLGTVDGAGTRDARFRPYPLDHAAVVEALAEHSDAGAAVLSLLGRTAAVVRDQVVRGELTTIEGGGSGGAPGLAAA